MGELEQLQVGDRVWFDGEVQGYTVQARGERYLICTKPFNLRRTVLYTVVDLEEEVRGTENLLFGMGAETREEMLARLEGPSPSPWRTEVSYRNRVPLRARKMIRHLPEVAR
jgi:hypothetical protein